MNESFGLSEIGQILVPVRDVNRARDFYRDRLGMRFLFEFPGMAFFDAGGVRLYLAEPEAPDFRGVATIYYRVDDLDAAYETLHARGVEFAGAPHLVHRDGTTQLWMAFAKDPDGNNVGLMSEVPDTERT
ncbi:MAG TPA: VOC family protein [Candidatus Limnocylindrales bacterium]|nr:VOC family protein [Candidatus Limnocylindrales bacterium]